MWKLTFSHGGYQNTPSSEACSFEILVWWPTSFQNDSAFGIQHLTVSRQSGLDMCHPLTTLLFGKPTSNHTPVKLRFCKHSRKGTMARAASSHPPLSVKLNSNFVLWVHCHTSGIELSSRNTSKPTDLVILCVSISTCFRNGNCTLYSRLNHSLHVLLLIVAFMT